MQTFSGMTALGGNSVFGGQAVFGASLAAVAVPQVGPAGVAGCLAWWDFSQTSTLTVDASLRISAWASRIHGYTLVQSTQASMPTVNVGSINGHDAANWDGADDFMTCAQLGADVAGLDVPITVFAVYRMGDTSGNRVIWQFAGSNGVLQTYQGGGTTYVFERAEDGGTNHQYIAPTPGETGQAQMVVSRFSGDQLALWKDTVLQGAAAYPTGGTFTSNNFFVGTSTNSSAWTNMVLGELLVYNTSVQDADRGLIQNYLRAKWGTP